MKVKFCITKKKKEKITNNNDQTEVVCDRYHKTL